MRIFEPHAHMYARTTNDYEALAKAGVEYLV
jgi:predicted metal-dependent TIM-barrel fold hydrolase